MGTKKVMLCALVFFFIAVAACSALFFKSSGCGSGSSYTTGRQTIISDDIERVFYLKLPENYNADTSYPLIFAFHGFTSDYTAFSEGYYDLQDVVGEEAILVYPNALLKDNETQWDYENDLIFFDDLYAELEANLCFDKRRVFAVGHSNGAGMTHTLGCKRGDMLRAIAPVAGSFADYEDCKGQVAVIMIHGTNDDIMPVEGIKPTRDYWIEINNCSSDASETREGVDPACESYGGCDPKYYVQYCEHSEGHDWPDYAGDAIRNFFTDLPLAKPSSKTGTGDILEGVKGEISFKVLYPSDFVGTPGKLAVSLYPPGSTQPFAGSPDHILNMDVPLGDFEFGEVTEYNRVSINMWGVDYGDYVLSVNIYLEGGNYPIPISGKDYVGLQDITIDSNTIVVETPLELEFVIY